MKKKIIVILLLLSISITLPSILISAENPNIIENQEYYEKYRNKDMSLYVYNWGEYISIGEDDLIDVNKEFEKITGIKVYYTTFATNEELYAKLKSGGVSYDIIIPSDYMIGQLINEDMLEKINYSNVPNYSYIMENFKNLEYDPTNEYSVPYTWGLVGIFYNTDMVKDVVDSWEIFWDEKYKNEIIMFYNPRDTFGIGQKILGYSFNTEDEKELNETLEKMKSQKHLVQAYLMDEIFNKMNNGEAALAPYYNGDARVLVEENEHIAFAYPKEGTNMFVDAICIPKNSLNKEAAEAYINFLCEPEIALANTLAIGYATPNLKTYDLLDDDIKNNPIFYPDDDIIKKSEVYKNLTPEANKILNKMWIDLMREDGKDPDAKKPISTVSLIIIGSIITMIFLPILRKRKAKKNYNYS